MILGITIWLIVLTLGTAVFGFLAARYANEFKSLDMKGEFSPGDSFSERMFEGSWYGEVIFNKLHPSDKQMIILLRKIRLFSILCIILGFLIVLSLFANVIL